MTGPGLRHGAARFLALALAGSAAAQTSLPATPSRTAPPKVHGSPQPQPQTPNVLVLLADDFGIDMLASYGEALDPPPTPNLDALAAEGVLFRNVWSNPICSPTRATILTGRHSTRTGIGNIIELGGAPLPLEETTLPELLDLGTGGAYAHAAFGKWHLGDETVGGDLAPNLAGFGHFAGAASNFFGTEDYTHWTKIVDGTASPTTAYATTDTVNDASAWMQATPEPWFCYVAFHAPHVPYHAPPAELHTVDLSGANPVPGLEPKPYFRAMVEAMDTEIGRLLAEMDPGVRARTTILFLGDNGSTWEVTVPPFVPQHAKATLYEGGVRVPMIVAGATVRRPGRVAETLVNTTDLFATVAQIAGVDVEVTLPDVALDSISFVPNLANPKAPSPRKHLFAEAFQPNGTAAQPPPLHCAPPPTDYCQVDLGFVGPGKAHLSLCGTPLYGGAEAELALTGAPPNTPGWLVISDQMGNVPLGDGVLVPSPALTMVPVMTDAEGGFSTPQSVEWIFADQLYFAQVVLSDADGTSLLSNAIEFDYELADEKAVRDERYKLISNPWLCEEQLFDLELDPFEQVNLLDSLPLQADAALGYQELKAELARILAN